MTRSPLDTVKLDNDTDDDSDDDVELVPLPLQSVSQSGLSVPASTVAASHMQMCMHTAVRLACVVASIAEELLPQATRVTARSQRIDAKLSRPHPS